MEQKPSHLLQLREDARALREHAAALRAQSRVLRAQSAQIQLTNAERATLRNVSRRAAAHMNGSLTQWRPWL